MTSDEVRTELAMLRDAVGAVVTARPDPDFSRTTLVAIDLGREPHITVMLTDGVQQARIMIEEYTFDGIPVAVVPEFVTSVISRRATFRVRRWLNVFGRVVEMAVSTTGGRTFLAARPATTGLAPWELPGPSPDNPLPG